MLLASDVAYEKKSFKHLLHAFDVLVNSGGKILLSEPGRRYAQDFFPLLEKKGFQRVAFKYPVTLRGVKHTIGVHELTRP